MKILCKNSCVFENKHFSFHIFFIFLFSELTGAGGEGCGFSNSILGLTGAGDPMGGVLVPSPPSMGGVLVRGEINGMDWVRGGGFLVRDLRRSLWRNFRNKLLESGTWSSAGEDSWLLVRLNWSFLVAPSSTSPELSLEIITGSGETFWSLSLCVMTCRPPILLGEGENHSSLKKISYTITN